MVLEKTLESPLECNNPVSTPVALPTPALSPSLIADLEGLNLPDAAGATLSAPRFLSAGTPTPRAPCSVLLSPARLAPHSDMEGAAAPAAGPDLGPGAPGSPPEAGAQMTNYPQCHKKNES